MSYLDNISPQAQAAGWSAWEVAQQTLRDVLEVVAECQRGCHKHDKGDYWLAQVREKVEEMLR